MHKPENEDQKQHINQLSHRVIGLCIEVHRELGPGLLESAYEEALAYELTQSGLHYQRQLETPLTYKGVSLDCGYRVDFVVEDELILELKSVQMLQPIHQAQLLTYLKLHKRSLGLLLNFNVPVMREGIKRVAQGSLFRDENSAGIGILSTATMLLVSAFTWMPNRS
jgi:GxxExxY protein